MTFRRMHWLDALVARTVSRRARFFMDGWGSPEVLARLEREAHGFGVPELAEVRLRTLGPRGACQVQEGRFQSPAALGLLPRESHEARFRLLLPRGAPGEGPPPVCVLLAASGDEGFGLRGLLAEGLARQGVGALLLENPYYGGRRPAGQRGPALRTVADLLLMFRATVVEAVALLGWLLARGHPKVALSGYSMGGSLAAYAASLFPLPLAVVPLAPAHSAAPVFTQGVLCRLPDWEALGRGHGGPEAARERLATLLERSASTLCLPPLREPRRAILVAARADGFVPAASTLRLLQHWRGAELRYLEGGHVSAFFAGRAAITRALLDALERVPALQLPETGPTP